MASRVGLKESITVSLEKRSCFILSKWAKERENITFKVSKLTSIVRISPGYFEKKNRIKIRSLIRELVA
jgi:hypothetical protein